MPHVLLVTFFAMLVACAKEGPAVSQPSLNESSAFTYIGLTLDQARTAARVKGEKFRVIKQDGRDFPVTLDFVLGRINAEVVGDRVVDFSVEDGGKTIKPAVEGVKPENCRAYFDGRNDCYRNTNTPDGQAIACTEMACDTYQQPRCLDE